MQKTTIHVVENILNANDRIAAQNSDRFAKNHIYAINIMASPGAGKTSFIIRTIQNIADSCRVGVIEGDTAPVTIDSEKITMAVKIPTTQINTGGNCHLDAPMVSLGLDNLPLDDLDLVMIENVGNLVCPASFKLGNNKNVLIASIPEGDDKPYKYPSMYQSVDVLIINKVDLLPYVDFKMNYFLDGVKMLNPELVHFNVSCRTGDGISEWTDWLLEQVHNQKP